jgi:transcriptional regulator with XRE-family HTH domain
MDRRSIVLVTGLKQLRQIAGLTTRQVSEQTNWIATQSGNQAYAVSASWLSRLERGRSVPNLYVLESLGRVYGQEMRSMLRILGLSSEGVSVESNGGQTGVRPLRMKERRAENVLQELLGTTSKGAKTMLLGGSALGAYPFGPENGQHYLYGYIGAEDMTLYPLVLPPTIVQINTAERRVVGSRWQCELERPIYFCETRTGYLCSWCERRSNTLTVLAHPLSPRLSQSFELPKDIEIIGRVTALLMRLDRRVNGTTVMPAGTSPSAGVADCDAVC